MEIARVETFVAVAQRLSFSEAARALHLSQPAVSQHVAALERELDVKLFERTTRRVRLTPAGVALLARADTLLRAHEEARRAVAAAEGRIRGELSIAASLTVGGYVLPPALASLAAAHPEVRVRVTIENTEQVAEALLSGRVDLGFVEGDVAAAGVVLRPIREDELVLAAPAGHRFARYDAVPLEDALSEPFVLRERGSGTRQVAEAHLRQAGVDLGRLRVVAELSSIDAIKAAVAAGLGISIISRSALDDEDGALIARRLQGLRLTRRLAAATRAGAPLLPSAARLLELI
jgi:DNA-binding transcriptional LysR family regulator